MSGKSLNSCVTCGHKLRFFDSFCPACGTTRHIQCESCGNIYNLSASHCPACGSVNLVPNQGMSLFINLISIFIVFVVIVATFIPVIYEHFLEDKKIYKKNNVAEYKNNDIYQNENLYYEITRRMGGKNIVIEDMMEFSNLNSQDILALREQAVKSSSVFEELGDYTPSRAVFDIEDNIPWIGAYQVACVGTEGPNYKIGEGPSRESLTILNPELLLHPLVPSIHKEERSKCDESVFYIPKKVVYFKDINTITAYLDISSIKQKMGYIVYPYYLTTANARDLGYNSIFASEYTNVVFANPDDNFSLNISEPRGFWHKGYACNLPDGCNNYSPRDTRFEIKTPKLPAAIRVKLWKNTPRNKKAKADLTYEIVFE